MAVKRLSNSPLSVLNIMNTHLSLFQIKCDNRYCYDEFYCVNRYCHVKQACTYHAHYPKDQYCDIYKHACRKGVRRCYHQRHCGSQNMCKDGICQKRQCTRHKECLGIKACEYASGYCRDYDAYCYEGCYDYCKVA